MSSNNSVSHLLVPDSEQIQIVLTRSLLRSGNNTDIRVTSFNRRSSRPELRGLNQESRSRYRSPNRVPALLRRSSGSSGISSSPNEPKVTQYEELSTDDDVAFKLEEYLRSNLGVLEEFCSKYLSQESLEKLLLQRLLNERDKVDFLARWNLNNLTNEISISRRAPSRGLTVSIGSQLAEGAVRWQLARYISSVVSADAFNLYLADRSQTTLRKFSPLSLKPESEKYLIEEGFSLISFVAKRRKLLSMSKEEVVESFPDGLGCDSQFGESKYFLCLPILSAHGDIGGVIELHRREISSAFTPEDEDVANSYLIWGGIAFHYADMNVQLTKQKQLSEFLLDVVRSIFQDMVTIDAVIKKVMKFAQKLVDADRASLFLVDSKSKELYARIFDLDSKKESASDENDIEESSTGCSKEVKEIRFGLGAGIAGQVALSGKPLSIEDAYEDSRFNAEIDKLTGYRTKTILCMPVFIKTHVIGVVQMVNKRTGTFNREDEEAFETFAVYCGLALHHAKLYDKIRRSEQKSKVAVEILSYHNTCTQYEVDEFMREGTQKNIVGLDDFYFPPISLDDMKKVHYSVYMFFDLFGNQRFDQDYLYRFCMTVKKNYRRVPYHNWNHGWTVANSMYCILKKSNVFRPLESLALYVGSLCHDLDHRGKNNKFLADTASPLASIYTTSTMEHHHFNQTVTILQQEGHNIFNQMSSDEYKEILGNIKHCILATDLALFFSYKAKLQELINGESFSWGVSEHRLLIQAIGMTAADLCASAKAWELQKETVKVIFAEFYEQGDYEKSLGRTPMPLMDRDQLDQQPACQVGFISGICVPCYDLLYKLIPETQPLLEGCQKNLEKWQELADEETRKRESREKEEKNE